MIYSVWNPVAKQYDYFQSPSKPTDADTPVPNHLKSKPKSPVGLSSDVAWPLPSDAVRVGSGLIAKGSIAMVGGEVGLSGFEIGGIPVIPVVIVAAIGWFLLR